MVNTAVFYYDFKGKQEQVYKFDGVTNTVTQNYLNVGNAEIYGIEAELLFQPSRRWDFNFSGGWLHGKITKSETILQDSWGQHSAGRLTTFRNAEMVVLFLCGISCACNWDREVFAPTRPADRKSTRLNPLH